jgi:hypothetical protein
MATQYKDFAPTGFDYKGFCLHERQGWYVAPCTYTRDTGLLSLATWASQLEILVGTEYEIHRLGHWGCGWFEIVLVHPDHLEVVEEIEAALAYYPVLDDELYSSMVHTAAEEYWENASIQDRIEILAENGVSIFKARNQQLPVEVADAVRELVDE